MEEDIKYIQNTLWAMYKEFTSSHNAKNYTNHAKRLCDKYKDDSFLLSVCENFVISWTPIINRMSESYILEENS